MTSHFKPGQTVRLNGGFPHRHAAEGVYVVVRPLPSDDGERRYCIKSASEQYQRVVKESDVEPA